jgi:tetratricopeptide (TPR) repeat protein
MAGMIRNIRPLLVIVVILLVGILPILLSIGSDLDTAEFELNSGNYARAAERYDSAAMKMPWRLGVWEQAGIAWFYAKDFDQAFSRLDRVRSDGSLTPEGWTVLGELYLAKSQPRLALEVWKKGLEEYPEHREFDLNLSRAYRGLGDYSLERDALDHWIASGRADAEAHFRLALLTLLTDPNTALDELRSAASLDRDYNDVVETLRTTVYLADIELDGSESLLIIGRGLGLVNEWHLAKDSFEQAVQIDPHNAEAWAWLGETESQLGGNGLTELDRALELDPSSAVVHALRSRYWKRVQEIDRALADELIAAELEPLNPAWQVAVGESHYLLGDLAAALSDYQRAVELAPRDPTYLRLLAIFCAENSVHVEDIGIPAALKAVELKPGNPQMLDSLGWAYYSSGRYTLAEQSLDEAINLDPLNFPAHLHRAMTYLAVGRSDDAFDELILVRDASQDPVLSVQADHLILQYFQ